MDDIPRPYRIVIGHDRYHESEDMIKWCREHIGYGDWNRFFKDNLQDDIKWDVEQMFGQTIFRFAEAKDYSKFVVKWEWANGRNHTS